MHRYILSCVLSAFIRKEVVSRFEMFYFIVVALTIVVVSFHFFIFSTLTLLFDILMFRTDSLNKTYLFNTKCFNFVKPQVWISWDFTNTTEKNRSFCVLIMDIRIIEKTHMHTHTHAHTQTQTNDFKEYNNKKYST